MKEDIRYLLIDLYCPYIHSSDFLPPEYDKAVTGISYHPDDGYRITYNYTVLYDLIESNINKPVNTTQEIINMVKNKPSVELSVDFKEEEEDIEKVSEEEREEQQFLSDEMEKIASEELTEDTSENTSNGKTFVSEE